MPRPKLTDEQRIISQQKRRDYKKNYAQNYTDDRKTEIAAYKKNWDTTHSGCGQMYVEDHTDRSTHYWTCTREKCDRCDAVIAWNKDRIARGLSPCVMREK